MKLIESYCETGRRGRHSLHILQGMASGRPVIIVQAQVLLFLYVKVSEG